MVEFRKFLRYLYYKAQFYGRQVIEADTFFPSSKLCSVCGYKKENLKLSEREWICPVCGTKHDRDVNAGLNLLKYGLTHLTGGRAGTVRTYACGEANSLCEAGSSIFYKME